MISKAEFQKVKLKSIVCDLLQSGYDIVEFGLINCDDPLEKKKYVALMRKFKKAKNIVNKINHIEILASLYNSFVSGKESYFAVLCASIIKNVEKWDTTKKGFEEFMALEEEARAKFKEESEERTKTQETIRQAREKGQKIEMVFENGKIIPVVVEEENKE